MYLVMVFRFHTLFDGDPLVKSIRQKKSQDIRSKVLIPNNLGTTLSSNRTNDTQVNQVDSIFLWSLLSSAKPHYF